MAYTEPVAADLKTRFPAFAAVADATIDIALGDAALMVDDTWLSQADFTLGRLLYAAHVLTLDGYGTGAEAEAAAAGAGGYKVMKSGSLTLERFDGAGAGAGTTASATTYGARFTRLLYANRGGARVATA